MNPATRLIKLLIVVCALAIVPFLTLLSFTSVQAESTLIEPSSAIEPRNTVDLYAVGASPTFTTTLLDFPDQVEAGAEFTLIYTFTSPFCQTISLETQQGRGRRRCHIPYVNLTSNGLGDGFTWVSGGDVDSSGVYSYAGGDTWGGQVVTFTITAKAPTLAPTDSITKSFYLSPAKGQFFVTGLGSAIDFYAPWEAPSYPYRKEVRIIQLKGAPATTAANPGTKPRKETIAPALISPGELLTYTFRLINEGTTTLPSVEDIELPLPANTVYQSGGTYNAGQNKVTYPNLGALNPGGVVTFTLVVQVPLATSLGAVIDAPSIDMWYPTGGGSYSSVTGFVPGKTSVVAAGTTLATYRNPDGRAFDPTIHGYGFQNYGQHAGASDDLGVADVFDLFGPAACSNKDATRATCKLTAAGSQWLSGQLSGMTGGHCEGMAVTSQRFFETLTFDGKTTAGDFQSGVGSVFGLAFPGQSVENYVASYFVRQIFSEVSTEAYQSRQTMTPGQIVDKLTEEFNKTPSVGYALGFYKPGYKEGHAVTPYAIERVGATDEYRIVVYDNNFPGQKRFVTVNKATNQWSYTAAADPTQAASLYEGNAGTKTLEINRISLRDLPTGQYFKCPFCGTTGQVSASAAVSETLVVNFDGQGRYQIVDDQGRRSGYDFDTDTEITEITGSTIVPVKGGLGLDLPGELTTDVSAAAGLMAADANTDILYQAYVGGATVDSVTKGNFHITGSDFVMGAEDIFLTPGDLFRFDFSPAGNEIYYEATSATVAPSIFMAFGSPSDTDPGLIVEIDRVVLNEGEVTYIGVDTDNERVYLVATPDTIPVEDRYLSITVTSFWPDGGEDSNTYDVILPKGTRSAYLDYGKWTEGGSAPLVIEHSIYLPAVQR